VARRIHNSTLSRPVGPGREVIPSRPKEQFGNMLADPLPEVTETLIFGRITLPLKAAAVIRMRRAGTTTYLQRVQPSHLELWLIEVRNNLAFWLPCKGP